MPTLTIAGSVSYSPDEPPGGQPGCYVVLRACRGGKPGRTGGRLLKLGVGGGRNERQQAIGQTYDAKLNHTLRTFGPLGPGVYQAEVMKLDGALVCPLVEVVADGVRYCGMLGPAPKVHGTQAMEETR